MPKCQLFCRAHSPLFHRSCIDLLIGWFLQVGKTIPSWPHTTPHWKHLSPATSRYSYRFRLLGTPCQGRLSSQAHFLQYILSPVTFSGDQLATENSCVLVIPKGEVFSSFYCFPPLACCNSFSPCLEFFRQEPSTSLFFHVHLELSECVPSTSKNTPYCPCPASEQRSVVVSAAQQTSSERLRWHFPIL